MSNSILKNEVEDKLEIKGLSGESLNILGEKINKIKEIFPEAICEGKIDFERLSEELGHFKEDKEERYRFEWAGKSQAIKIAQTPSMGTLRPCKEESKNWDTTQNLYIEGDNLEVLKLLQKSYQNKIKMIYIDPPYNTDNDFIYKDKTKDSIKNYFNLTGQLNENGKLESTSREINGRFHTNWLNMIYPRLSIAKNLLSDNGLIFISIDFNELVNMKKVCDEIFGEEKFIANIALEITKTQGMKVKAAKEGSIVKNHEYVLCYSKNDFNKKIVKNVLYDLNSGYDTHFSYYITENNGIFKVEKLTDKMLENIKIKEELKRLGFLQNDKFSIKKLESAILVSDLIRKYIYEEISENIFQEMACEIKLDKEILKELNKYDIVKFKKYLLKKSSGGKVRQYSSLRETLNYTDEYNSQYGRVTIRGDLWKGFYSDMMNVSKEGNCEFKNGKKPIRLIKQLMKWIGVEDNEIVLDFFSGSGSTAHAVMAYNKENSSNVKNILVQIPQKIKNEKEKTICDLAKKRIKNLENEFSDIDVGFKVFKLDSSNIKRWNPNYDNIEQTLDDMEESFVKGRTEEDILYELMLKAGIDITYLVEEVTVNDKKIFNIGFGELLVCLDNDITIDIANEIVNLKNDRTKVIFKEAGFKDDSAKTNVLEILKRNKIKEVISV